MHSNDDNIGICFLKEYPSLMEGILSLLNISKNQIKKSNLSKKKLNSKVLARCDYYIPIDLVNFLFINPIFNGAEPKIITEDEQILALSKPAKIHCHPLRYAETDNLLSYLSQCSRNSELEINNTQYDRGLLYRLDFETSGLVLYAKTEEIFSNIRNNFKELVKEKTYLAIVDGECKTNGELTHYLTSSGPKGSIVEVSDSFQEHSSKVQCFIKTLKYNQGENITLVEIKLNEGHRHQIRKQLEGIGHSILGDPLYGVRSSGRMYLHCWKYTIQGSEEKIFQDDNYGLFSNFFDFNS